MSTIEHLDGKLIVLLDSRLHMGSREIAAHLEWVFVVRVLPSAYINLRDSSDRNRIIISLRDLSSQVLNTSQSRICDRIEKKER